jgi:peptidoglycan/xylan/chitin deacetylase (PgdA/CDA1 family)
VRRRSGSITVLAYHAIGDVPDDPVLAPYTVAVNRFRRHLDMLLRSRHRFMDVDELLNVVHGNRPAPPRGVLLSFDDGYADLLTTVAPVLRRCGVPAVAFAVAGALGATNSWDTARGASELPLLTATELQALASSGIEVGSHSRSHADLTRLSGADLQREVAGSRAELAEAGLPRPRVFSYPYGAVDANVADAVRAAGYDLAFTIAHGAVHGPADPLRLPRVQVCRQDSPARLRLKLAAARARRAA